MPTKSHAPAKGDLLISEPFLPDPNFERSVILLCEHNEEGSLGFVLNKPTALKLQDALDEAAGFDKTLYAGGPVQMDTLHFIHRSVGLADQAENIGNGIYWGGDFERLLTMMNTRQLPPEDVKFFVGYSGWSAGQLEKELEQNSWIVCKGATEQQVFQMSPDLLWRQVLASMGGKFKMYSNYPIDPRLN